MKNVLKKISLIMAVLFCFTAFLSCSPKPNSNPTQVEVSLRSNGYSASSTTETTPLEGFEILYEIDYLDGFATGSKHEGDKIVEVIFVFYFRDETAAKKGFIDLEKYSGYALDVLDNTEAEWVFEQTDNMVYYGTMNAIKAAK